MRILIKNPPEKNVGSKKNVQPFNVEGITEANWKKLAEGLSNFNDKSEDSVVPVWYL
jgi:hypothetical protein